MRQDPASAARLASDSLPGQVIDVVVLTADAGLLATLRNVSAAEHALWHASSADVAVDCLVGGRCGILIADLDALRGDAASFFQRLHAQFPELVMVATGRREEEGTVTTLVGCGDVYRFLHKPVSPERARLFLAAATRRYSEIRDIEPIALTTVRTIAARRDLRGLTLVIAAVLAALVAYIAWHSRDTRLPVVLPAPAQTPPVEERVAQELARANIAYATGRLIEPRGDNALQYFREALTLQPDQPEALAGVERVIALLEIRFEQALQARDAPGAAAILMAIQQAQPQRPGLDGLRSRLLGLSRSLHSVRSPARPAGRPAAAAPPPAPAPADTPVTMPAANGFSPRGERASADELAHGVAATRDAGDRAGEGSAADAGREALEQARREAELKQAIEAEIEMEAMTHLEPGPESFPESPSGDSPGADRATVHEHPAHPETHPDAPHESAQVSGSGRIDLGESSPGERP